MCMWANDNVIACVWVWVCIYLVAVYMARPTLMWSCLSIYICPVFLQLLYILCHSHISVCVCVCVCVSLPA